MSKELTPLEAWEIIKSLEVLINEDCDSTLVEDLPESKVIETALKDYEHLYQIWNCKDSDTMIIQTTKTIHDENNKKLKAFELIIEKKIDLKEFIVSLKEEHLTYDEYCEYADDFHYYIDNHELSVLTQEEYDLLKEVLL